MLANIAPMARRSATVTAAVAAVMVALSAVLGGQKGVIGAAIAVVVVAAFFGLSVLALSKAAKVSPQAMMLAGMGTYFVKILVLVYDIALAVSWSRTKMLYVEPDGER
jgi:ATP synthase protein I